MNKDDILMWVMILFIVIILYKLYIDSDYFQLKCIVSTVDGDKYCVRERKNMKEATDLLAKTTTKMKKLVEYVDEKYPNKEDCIIAEANEVWEELMLLKNTDKEIAPKTTTEIEVNEESNDK